MREITPFWQGFQKAFGPSGRASEGVSPSSSSSEDLGHALQKGQAFPASGPDGSCRRAKKLTCDFADAQEKGNARTCLVGSWGMPSNKLNSREAQRSGDDAVVPLI
jgi:hypothetical protein